MGKRNGFVVASEKGTAEETTECCDIGLGLMMQKTHQSFPRKKMMMMMMPHHHHDHHEQPLLSSGDSFGGEACGVFEHSASGPLFCNTSNPVTSCISDIYNAVGSDFGSVVPKSLQQPYSDRSLSFSPSGGMVNVNVRLPFTPAQREELERQTMIYKYMMSSAPVPPHLLVPIAKNPSNVAHLYPNLVRGSLELGFSSNSDPEPWRCKRTDGKKWRCSRDVAPDQKYCERHAHKSRPRSRKPVESNPNFINNNTTTTTRMRSPRSNFVKNNICNQPSPFSTNMVSPTAPSHAQPRSMAWFMNGETPTAPTAGGSNQEWEQMMQFKLGLKSCHTKCNTDVDVSKQQNENSFNLYREYTGESQGLQTQRPSHDQYGLLLSPKLAHLEGALNSNQTQHTRHFIDAWSTTTERDSSIGEIGNRGYVSSNQKLPFSSLTLSMSRGNETNEESDNTQMGLGILGSERENVGDLKSQWMNPLSCMSSPPGGPLAEALCLGIASSTRATSSNGCTSGSTSSGDGVYT
ncbi:growth-regulating factor 8 isoform X2 [Prunus avium]|uniref:Growth-regulating factor n=1 Tax=Prunus avium TaxID=42229 RepID=A0A6P5SS78_PRUAV|nr:growth-regulating factor 8 isoform X2 [Prunus avium]